MALSKDDLLKPRYKVIADFPAKFFDIGTVLHKHHRINDWLYDPNLTSEFYGYKESCVLKYPHLFRKLEWHENRKQEEMPEYVKWREEGPFGPLEIGGNIEKVELIEPAFGSWAIKVPSQINGIRPEYFMPATEAEFNSQKQATNG